MLANIRAAVLVSPNLVSGDPALLGWRRFAVAARPAFVLILGADHRLECTRLNPVRHQQPLPDGFRGINDGKLLQK